MTVQPAPDAGTAPRAVLFDLDGTLVDSIELIVRAYQHTTTTHLGAPLAREVAVATIGRHLEAVLEELAPGRGPLLTTTYREFVYEHHDRFVRAFPGIVEVLHELRRRGYQLGIVTAKSRAQAALAFALCALEPLVDVTICHEDAPRPKPAPDPLLVAAARLGLPPAACLYVGDATYDLLAARAAGMGAVAVSWGAGVVADLLALAPDFLLDSPTALLDCCPPIAQ